MHICRSQSASAPQLCPPLAAAPQKSLCGMLPKLTMIAVVALGCTDAVPLDRRLPVSPADRRSRLASLSDRDASMSSSRSEDVEVACSRLLALEQRWSWCGVHNSDPERCTTTSAIEHANRARHFCVYDYNARRCRMDAVGWRCPAAPASPPWVAQSATPACSASLPKDERTLLFELSPAFHGSTAMQSIMMSSSRVATLCRAQTHECEAQWLHDEPEEAAWQRPSAKLAEMAAFWQLDRPVLLIKDAGFQIGHVEWWLRLAQSLRNFEALSQVALPSSMQHAGVRRLSTAYMLVWRPWCLWRLSQSSSDNKAKYAADQSWPQHELMLLEQQVVVHERLVADGRAVLAISYADLLWEPELTKRRIESFLPCAGSIDFDFVATLGEQVFKGNDWKIFKSVRSFGETHAPSDCGYDRDQRICTEAREFLAGCSEACKYSHDGVCDDGGPGAEGPSPCTLGSDCEDCGRRPVQDWAIRFDAAVDYLRANSRLQVAPVMPPVTPNIPPPTPPPPFESPGTQLDPLPFQPPAAPLPLHLSPLQLPRLPSSSLSWVLPEEGKEATAAAVISSTKVAGMASLALVALAAIAHLSCWRGRRFRSAGKYRCAQDPIWKRMTTLEVEGDEASAAEDA